MHGSSFTTRVILAFAAVLCFSSVGTAGLKGKADLVGIGDGRAKVQYFEGTDDNGVFVQRLKVQVKRSLPSETLEVTVDGAVVGTIDTNPAGNGKLHLETPDDVLPPIASGSIITVGPLSGMLFTNADKYKVHGDVALEGTTVVGHVKYQQKPKHGELDRRFHVSVSGAAAGEIYDVYVNDVLVGSITIGDDGEGQLKLRESSLLHGNGWQPMEHDFPNLVAGDVVEVGTMSTTLS
ncbi:MAG: hypothetical protein L0Y44_11515 [Phycisphaerales bacterium]|nr:hypothetical protein [Phycisphaerales bacterium]MCI0674916.1 hypothetical protein [Phycisphaerales bacterium]